MSPNGHKLTGAALAFALGYIEHQQGNVMEAALVAAGALFGARAPDWTEIARWENGRRYSLIPHRGPTHWPGVWIIGLVLAILYLPSPYVDIAKGFCASALLHLFMDVMTPMGIPLWNPFTKKRFSLKMYKTGVGSSEWTLVVLCWFGAGSIFLNYR